MKLNYLPIFILLQFMSISLFGYEKNVSYDTEAPLIDHMISINNEWTKQKDIPTHLMTIPIKFNSDEERIQLHLKLVEKTLKARSSDDLTIQQFANRQKNLQSLMSYWKENKFPINTRHSHRQPYFIDDFGTACAVGHLLLTSGEEDLAHHISDVQNYAYIHELHYPELMAWASENGFTKDELAWIQPAYDEEVCYYVTEINVVQEYIDANQPLSQQDIKTVKYIPTEGFIYGGNFLHYNADGSTQTAAVFGEKQGNYISYGNAIQGTVYDIEYYDQRMYVAGDFVLAGTDFYNIAYWNGTDWVGIQTGDMAGVIRDMQVYQCRLYVGGDFTSVDGNNIANLVVWDGTTWSTTPQDCAMQSAAQALQVNGAVNTFEIYGSTLAIGGDFTQVMGHANTVEGLIFWNDLSLEFLPTHGSMSSVNCLETFGTSLVVGEDSLCVYKDQQWYYPGDLVPEPSIDLPYNYNGHWPIPIITDAHNIYYPFSNSGVPSFGLDHLLISANNEVWAINGSAIEEAYTPMFYADYRLEVDGTVSAMWGSGHTLLYAGNFNTVDALNLIGGNNNCGGNVQEANKLFEINRVPYLPIELSDFTVISDNYSTAHLKWTSLTESNSLHYEVQRRTDNEDFTRIGIVNAAGESLEEINYTFEDDISTLTGGHVYYRLKMVDKDGSFEYSEIRSLKLRDFDSTVSVYPNPAEDVLAISLEMPWTGDLAVNIYNLNGQLVNTHQWTYDTTLAVSEQIDISDLQSGIYLVEVVTPKERITKKLDIIK